MPASFRLTKPTRDAGWILGIGDALRASGKALAVLSRSLVAEPGKSAPPLTRIVVNPKVCRLEIRAHTATRCTRGRWQVLDTAPTPEGSRAWGVLANFWAWHVEDFTAGREPWSWADYRGGDDVRCGAAFRGPGRGRKVKRLPGGRDVLGWAAATGKACGTRRPTRGEATLPAGTTGARSMHARQITRSGSRA